MTATAELLSTVHTVTREVLETMFFCDAEPASCCHDEDSVAVRVAFEGGQMTLMISRELAVAASAGFLAEENGEVTAEHVDQVSRELANILCGAVLSRLHPDARVALGAPEVASADFGRDAALHQCFATPEGMLAITLRVD